MNLGANPGKSRIPDSGISAVVPTAPSSSSCQDSNPFASLVFYWEPLCRQVRRIPGIWGRGVKFGAGGHTRVGFGVGQGGGSVRFLGGKVME